MEMNVESTIILRMTIEEARLLKTLCQNIFDIETKEIKELKKDIFIALPSYEELNNL